MDVFLIPLGGDRYELYCEAPADETEQESEAPTKGVIARLKYRFAQVSAAAERARNRRASQSDDDEPTGMIGRAKAYILAWLADTIAEQRLLWHLRHQTEVDLHYPSDMTGGDVMRIARSSMQRDADRHRRWLAIDGILMILSGALILVPGPNIIGYYFAFRVVGHFLSWRGARQGLDCIEWKPAPCEPLADLRRAIGMAPPHRERKLVDVASRLRLDHLVTFVERLAFQQRARRATASS